MRFNTWLVAARLKTWLVAALGLGTLVILIAVSMWVSTRRAQEIYAQLDELGAHHRRVDEPEETALRCEPLRNLRSGLLARHRA